MPRFEPRPPAETGSPLSPATREILRRAGGKTGGLLFLIGEDRAVRSRMLREIGRLAEDRHLEVVRLRAFAQDRCAPYGAMVPWFGKWFRPTPEELQAPTALDHSFFTIMAGIADLSPGAGFSPVLGFGLDVPAAPWIGPATAATPSATPSLAPTPAPTSAPGPSSAPSSPGAAGAPLAPLDPLEMRTKLTELVHGRTREAPTVVTIEGAEHVDLASREWLSFVGGQLPTMPLVIVLSLDPGSPTFEAWRQAFAKVPGTWEKWPPPEKDDGPRESTPSPHRALDRDARSLLRAVDAAGPDATRELLLRVLSWDAARFDRAMGELRADGTLEEEGPRLEIAPHAVQGGGDLLPDDPGEVGLHRSLAEALEAQSYRPQGPALFRLGEHWAASGDVERAVPLLSAAASEAERWGSPELAVERLVRALGLLSRWSSPKAREAEERVQAQLAEVHHRASNTTGTVEAYERAMELAQSRGAPPEAWAAYIPGLARARTLLGEDPEALVTATLERVRDRSPEIEGSLWNVLGFFYRERGRLGEAAEVYERACALVDLGRDEDLRARVHEDAATFYIFGGSDPELDRACTHARQVLTLARRLEGVDQSQLRSGAFEVLSWVALSRGELQEAVEQGEAALAEARRSGFRAVVLEILGNQAEVHLECGRLHRARELAQELAEQCDRYGLWELDSNRMLSVFLEGRLALARGGWETAQQKLEKVVSLSEVAGSKILAGQALALLVVVAAERGDLDHARALRDRLDREDLRRSLPGFTLRHLEKIEPRLVRGAPTLR